jgi:hypothetical protein
MIELTTREICDPYFLSPVGYDVGHSHPPAQRLKIIGFVLLLPLCAFFAQVGCNFTFIFHIFLKLSAASSFHQRHDPTNSTLQLANTYFAMNQLSNYKLRDITVF